MDIRNRRKKEEGSVTIEAVIALSSFMFAIVTILTILNICMIQARMSVALHTTARELSQYSYLYSLTGFQKSEAELSQAAGEVRGDIDSIMADINTVFNEIENLGNTGQSSVENVSDISAAWDSALGSTQNIQAAGSSLEDTIRDIAKDPKQLMFGIAKLAGSEGLNLAKSRLVAAPLSKTLCRKHFTDSEGGDAETYLKQAGVVPSAGGSYMDGLDFSQSSLFPYGSNEITVDVSYDVKVIALLPLNLKFHFHQRAVTHGWLAGDAGYRGGTEYRENDTLWTKATIQERANLIRHMAISDLEKEGYVKTAGLTDVPLYHGEKNEFVMISSMNPLYSGEDEEPKSLSDLDEDALRIAIEQLCGKMKSTTSGLTNVDTKTERNGQTEKSRQECGGAGNKIMLVIPEDEGLKEKLEAVIAGADTRGVAIEVVPSCGKGVNKTAIPAGAGGGEEE
ncbi:MAG: hypothetical protein HFI63_05440 [Lachnospiraceae bacterium]|nr:hypothetical protein [Lachnospiraceae bacterium]